MLSGAFVVSFSHPVPKNMMESVASGDFSCFTAACYC